MQDKDSKYQLLPCSIRPYLIPFVMKEFLVKEEAVSEGVVAKVVDISVHNSFGKIIRMMCEKVDKPSINVNKFSVFIRVKNYHQKYEWKADVYKFASGQYSFLKLPQEAVDLINDHFEGVFSQSLLFYLEGYQISSDEGLRKGIDLFMQKYNLYDFDIDPESLRRAYYRYRETGKRLSFYCSKKSKRKIRCHT